LEIRRLGEIASKFMTIDEMVEVANEAAAQSGRPGVLGCTVDKLWDRLRDRKRQLLDRLKSWMVHFLGVGIAKALAPQNRLHWCFGSARQRARTVLPLGTSGRDLGEQF
jgi:hypothetical protein